MDIFEPIKHKRTADDVVSQIELLVLDGILRPSDKLPGERELSEKLQVSRPVLREAIAQLETRGIITARQGGGTYIADLVGEVFSPAMLRLIATHKEAVRDYLDYRLEMEGIAAEYAAKRLTEHDRAAFKAIMDEMHQAFQTNDATLEADIDVRFHTLIAESAHNIVLLHTMRSCYRLLSDGVFFNRDVIYARDGARKILYDQHLAIGEAILDGNADNARQAAQDHILYIISAMDDAARSGAFERVSKLRRLRGESPP